MRFSQILILAFIFSSIACAPQAEKAPQYSSDLHIEPKNQDTDLRSALSNKKISTLRWNETVNTAVLYRQSQNLVELGLGKKWLSQLETLTNFSSAVPFADSPYIEVLISKAQKEINPVLIQTIADLERDVPTVSQTLKSSVEQHGWPETPQQVDTLVYAFKSFLTQLKSNIDSLQVNASLKTAVTKEIDSKGKELIQKLDLFKDRFNQAPDLSELLLVTEGLIKEYEIELSAEALDGFARGRLLAADVNSCHDSQTAMTVIIRIWSMLTDEERKAQFQPVSPELYDYLKGKSERSLKCLAEEECKNFVKNVIILKKVKKVGIEGLCKDLKEKTLEQGRGMVLAEFSKAVKTLGPYLETMFQDAVKEEMVPLRSAAADLEGFIKEEVNQWAKAKMPKAQGQINGFEAAKIKISLEQNKVQVAVPKNNSLASIETIGTALAAKTQSLSFDKLDFEIDVKTAIEQVTKLFGLGGYRDKNDQLVPAIFRPLSNNGASLDIEQAGEMKESYAAFDFFNIKDGFKLDINRTPNNSTVSAKSQAEIIRGMSHLIYYLRDWEVNQFDRSIGQISLQNVIHRIQDPGLQRPLFPKGDLMALSIANAAVLLKNLTKENSAVFFVNWEHKIIWANENLGEAIPVMAGVVDIVAGQRVHTVKSEDVAKYLIAMAYFYEATAGIEKTNSSALKSSATGASAPVDSIREARDQIKLLIIALANFLSNHAVNKNGLVVSSISLENFEEKESRPVRLLDQALTLRALMVATEITRVEAYAFSALDLYYSMNNKIFDPELRFYSADPSDRGHVPTVIEMLRALKDIRHILPSTSQVQLDQITAPWLQAISKLQ